MLPRAWARYIGTEKLGRLTLEVRAAAQGSKFNHRQIIEATLIRAEAIGRTEPHAEVAMKDQAERFPTVVASHAFNMRQRSSLALHLRSPFPRLRKTNAKTFGGFPTTPASGPHRHTVQIHTGLCGSAPASMERFRIA